MRIGAHALVWTGAFDQAGIEKAVTGAARAGFDHIEFPVFEPEDWDAAHTRALLDEHGLTAAASLGLPEDRNISSADPTVVAAGRDHLYRVLDVLAAFGGTHLCGVIYSPLKKQVRPATPEEVANSRAALGTVAARAADLGIAVSLEVVNRYESNLFNTARGALAYLEGVDGDVGVHLDTYHMNIEESDLFQPVAAAGDLLRYVHIGESHRGYLGTGTVDFGAFFRALSAAGYDGPIVFESFSSAVVSADLTGSLGIWRNLWEDSDDLAAHANRFIRDALRAVETISLH
jgi:D-psicose/D-tagatose/L-ribulose 3-epimerase